MSCNISNKTVWWNKLFKLGKKFIIMLGFRINYFWTCSCSDKSLVKTTTKINISNKWHFFIVTDKYPNTLHKILQTDQTGISM